VQVASVRSSDNSDSPLVQRIHFFNPFLFQHWEHRLVGLGCPSHISYLRRKPGKHQHIWLAGAQTSFLLLFTKCDLDIIVKICWKDILIWAPSIKVLDFLLSSVSRFLDIFGKLLLQIFANIIKTLLKEEKVTRLSLVYKGKSSFKTLVVFHCWALYNTLACFSDFNRSQANPPASQCVMDFNSYNGCRTLSFLTFYMVKNIVHSNIFHHSVL